MKKKIAREILYIVSFALIVGLFSVCIVSYNKMNINKQNKIPPELQNNFSFLQEKNIESVCFNNGKFDYTIPIDLIGNFTTDRSDLKLVGKISIKYVNVEDLIDLTLDDGFEEVKKHGDLVPNDDLPPDVLPADFKFKDEKVDEYGIPIKDNGKSIEKLSDEESAQINAFVENTKLYKKYSNLILTEKDIYYNIKTVAIILLIVLFVIRYLFYIVDWSIKTLKE